MQLVHRYSFSCSKNTGINFSLIEGGIEFHDSGDCVSVKGVARGEILRGINMALTQAHYYEDTRGALEEIIATATDEIRKLDSAKKPANGELVES